MKKRFAFLPFLVVALFSCKKEIKGSVDGPIVGNWSLTGADGSFLNLTKEGHVEKRKWDTTLNVQYDRYQVLTDSTVKFFRNGGPSVVANYSLSNNNLILDVSGACFYACEEQFGRILPTD